MATTKKIKSIITDAYFKANSPVPENFNISDIYSYFNVSERLYIVPIIGEEQYYELLEQVSNNNVTPENSTLLLQIYPLLSYGICYQALPFIAVHFSEVGITKGKSDNSESIDVKDLSYISTRLESTISTLKKQLIDWLQEYLDTFPHIKEWWETDKCECGNHNKHDLTKRQQIYSPYKKQIDIR